MAFHIPMSQESRVVRLRVQDKNGNFLAGGERQIRIVSPSRLSFILLILALLPLLVMVVVRAARARKYTQ